ncbi:uncharacterized protein PRCAT00006322001 [Priceomyces carsonii]|uniref:uncharacterized protein n=1 Tax=Priceomyces carsonii TaxID=28549 RepID=UPI002EDB4058|nr:unnamed protein product [Priceomyces carsonii]
MPRIRSKNDLESLSISRCKRIIRPLLSKIHNLTDLSSKSPTLLEFKFPDDFYLEAFKNVSKTQNIDLMTALSSESNKISKSTVRRNLSDRHKKYSKLKSPSDASEENHGEDKIPSPLKVEFVAIQKFVRPKSALERLASMSPFISSELFERYSEIFQIFKNIINLITLKHSSNKVPKLASLCARNLGKSMVFSTKTTYYKMNQSLLFDPKTIPQYLQKYEYLDDDVDYWLQLEPEMITESYRLDVLLGYILNLVAFNLGLTLYMLIPVLLHWLYEELVILERSVLKSAMETLFTEFWEFNDFYSDDCDGQWMLEVHAPLNSKANATLFWTLHRLGYWENLVDTLNLCTNLNTGRIYESLLLNTIAVNYKFDYFLTSLCDEESGADLLELLVYPLLKKNPQHPSVNDITIRIITELIKRSRLNIKRCKTSTDFLHHFNVSYHNLFKFSQTWLSFSCEHELVFNSLYPGNERIFEGILRICSYLLEKCKLIMNKVETTDLDINEDADFLARMSLVKSQFKNNFRKFETMKDVMNIFKLYFIDLPGEISISSENRERACDFIVKLQGEIKKLHHGNTDLNEFLLWLTRRSGLSGLMLARGCFRRYYGYENRFYDTTTSHLFSYLFQSNCIDSYFSNSNI